MGKVAVLGAGSWGTTFAAMACAQGDTVLWARRAAVAGAISRTGRNPDYFPHEALPSELAATGSLEEALDGAGVVVVAVPSHHARHVLAAAAPAVASDALVVSLVKGVEQGSLERVSQIAAEALPARLVAVLTGPNFAAEVLAGHPTASVLASESVEAAEWLQQRFTTETFRIYASEDVVGCEVAGALKNVVAMAVGMADGMGLGDNTKGALITRGLAEMSRLGRALGGEDRTFFGLAGLGDLVATCMSARSRNRHVGQELGRGKSLDSVLAEMSTVAEGVRSAPAVVELAARHGVEMPISERVVAVLAGECKAVDAIPALMTRELKRELP